MRMICVCIQSALVAAAAAALCCCCLLLLFVIVHLPPKVVLDTIGITYCQPFFITNESSLVRPLAVRSNLCGLGF